MARRVVDGTAGRVETRPGDDRGSHATSAGVLSRIRRQVTARASAVGAAALAIKEWQSNWLEVRLRNRQSCFGCFCQAAKERPTGQGRRCLLLTPPRAVVRTFGFLADTGGCALSLGRIGVDPAVFRCSPQKGRVGSPSAPSGANRAKPLRRPTLLLQYALRLRGS